MKKIYTIVKTHKKETAILAYGIVCMGAGAYFSREHYNSKLNNATATMNLMSDVTRMTAYQQGLTEGMNFYKTTTFRK